MRPFNLDIKWRDLKLGKEKYNKKKKKMPKRKMDPVEKLIKKKKKCKL